MDWLNKLQINQDIKVLLEQIVRTVETEVPRSEQLSGVTFMGTLDGDISTIPLHMVDDDEKQLMDAMLRRIADLSLPDFSVTVLETWFIHATSPKELKERVSRTVGRKQGILLLIETRYESITVLGEISTDRKQISWQKPAGSMEGLFNNLLPKTQVH